MPPRGKFSKPSRGGGKKFSRDVQPTDKNGNPVSLWRDPADEVQSSSDEDEEEEEESGSEEEPSDDDEEEEEGDGKAGASSSAEANMTREERRAAAKAKKQAAIARRKQMATQPGDLPPSESEDENEPDGKKQNKAGEEGDGEDLPANPNHTAKSRQQLEKDDGETPASKPKKDLSQLSRREREALEAQQERERYMKLHAEGKTEEARSDLARLALVREQREAERLRKEVEKEEKEALAKERAAAREALLSKKTNNKKGGSKKK